MKKFTAVILSVVCFGTQLFGQDSTITDSFNNYASQTFTEKIFVHTDKEFYQAGEILWFRLYALDGYFHKPARLSKIGYVELIDASNRQVLNAKVSLDSSAGEGSFNLPSNILTGNYLLRAYTRWMKNFSAEFYFEKSITIINTEARRSAPADRVSNNRVIAFFPEGGNLLAGIPNKVGFSIKDVYGQGTSGEGTVTDDSNMQVINFKTSEFGLGVFTFTPQAGKKYSAVVRLSDGDSIRQSLPELFTEGYAMSLQPKGNAINITVHSTSNDTLFLVVQTRGMLKSVQQKRSENGVAVFNVEVQKLGDGISQFTIFNNQRQPVCERLYFKYPSKNLSLNIQLNKDEFGPRQKVTADISLPENADKADLSFAVHRIDSLVEGTSNGIVEYLWLTSDLTGLIESPGYYFSENHHEAIDNVMLTHGWRRFTWKNVMTNKKPVIRYEPEIRDHIVQGKIININTNALGANVQGFISVPGKPAVFENSLSDLSGKIRFEPKNFYGDGEMIAQTNFITDNLYKVDIENPFSTDFSSRKPAPFKTSFSYPSTVLKQYISAQVQQVFFAGKAEESGPDVPPPFYQQASSEYILSNYTQFTTMEEVLREYVKPVGVTRQGKSFHAYVYNENTRMPFTENPLVLLDGIPVFDDKKLMDYDPLKLEKIDIVTKKYFLSESSYGGIINMLTYKGTAEGYELDPNATVLNYNGLQLKREFYSPVYETPVEQNNHLPDFRNVLYWQPRVKTSNGKAHLEFFTSDLSGEYEIILQGTSGDGACGFTKTKFRVAVP